MSKKPSVRIQLNLGMGFEWVEGMLPFFAGMGFKRLYLSPFCQYPVNSENVLVNSGYDPLALSVSEELGGGEKFRQMSEAALALGIEVSIDVVHHMRPESALFVDQASRERLFFVEHGRGEYGSAVDYFGFGHLLRLRTDDAAVCSTAYGDLVELADLGLITGFVRVDYADGLPSPSLFAGWLTREFGLPVVFETTLEPGQELPENVLGTTGTNFFANLVQLHVNAAGLAKIRSRGAALMQEGLTFQEHCDATARDITARYFRPHAEWLLRELKGSKGAASLNDELAAVGIEEMLVALGTCPRRICLDHSLRQFTAEDIHAAEAMAAPRVLRDILTGKHEGFGQFAVLFDMTVNNIRGKSWMIAGCKDLRVVPFNEGAVSADVQSITGDQFHARNLERARGGEGLNTDTTHDTTMNGFPRAMAVALTHHAGEFLTQVDRWDAMNKQYGNRVGEEISWAAYQVLTVCGLIGLDDLYEYLYRTAREAGYSNRTSWAAPNEEYERALRDWLVNIYGNVEFTDSLEAFRQKLLPEGMNIALSWQLLKLTPGQPDFYQAYLNWSALLRDPHNRRAPDWDVLSGNLARFERGEQPTLEDAMQWLIWKMLNVVDEKAGSRSGYSRVDAGKDVFAFEFASGAQVRVPIDPAADITSPGEGWVNVLEPLTKLGFRLGLFVRG